MSTTETPTTDPSTASAALDERPTDERIVDVTADALEQILEIRAGEDEADALRLRIEVTGVSGVDYVYDLAFETADDAKDGDVAYAIGDLTVVIPEDSVAKLQGSVLDLPSSPMQSGLVLRNPNRPNPLAGKQLELSGDLPEKVQQLLDESINPALGAHGGFVSLAGVEDTVVYLSMGGGCQGCTMSQATMVEGVTLAIHDAIPEVTDVIDVTDHAAGENPFYS
jgi:Fe/S biogenesis protein NfuA